MSSSWEGGGLLKDTLFFVATYIRAAQHGSNPGLFQSRSRPTPLAGYVLIRFCPTCCLRDAGETYHAGPTLTSPGGYHWPCRTIGFPLLSHRLKKPTDGYAPGLSAICGPPDRWTLGLPLGRDLPYAGLFRYRRPTLSQLLRAVVPFRATTLL